MAGDMSDCTQRIPQISVVLPTRDRSDRVLGAVRAVVAGDFRDFEIVVVDQSIRSDTEDAIAACGIDAALRYLRSETRGLSNGLNVGIGAARGGLIAITGDDCEPRPDWLSRIHDAFGRDERIGIVFGAVRPGSHDVRQGFVAAYARAGTSIAYRVTEKDRAGGTSACMAVRQRVWTELHGFDPLLGVGAMLRAGEETDLAIRALCAGYYVFEDSAIEVTHKGFMPWSELDLLIERNWFGTGAAVGKLLKRRPGSGLLVLARLGWRWTSGQSGVSATLGQGSHRWLRLVAFAQGTAAGLGKSIDPATGHFAVFAPKLDGKTYKTPSVAAVSAVPALSDHAAGERAELVSPGSSTADGK